MDSRPQSIPTGSNSETLTGAIGDLTYSAPERGRWGITVTDKDDKTTILPGVAGRYERGSGLIYRVPSDDDQHVIREIPASDVTDVKAWTRWGWTKPDRDHMTVWLTVARSWPLISMSPTVLQGLPPLAPTLAPVTEDVDASRAAWAELAHYLTPTGRLVLGMALTSPWMEQAGTPPVVVHIHGEAGQGKTIMLHLAAALFGESRALVDTFDGTSNGISSAAQSRSYLPMMLDEVQSSTGSIEATLRALVMGASRQRADRSGSAVSHPGRWHGLALTSGNDPLDLSHEMFSRRMLEIESSDLWQNVPDGLDRTDWWAERWASLKVLAGWPWEELQADFTPGTDAAEGVPSFAASLPLPGEGSLGLALRLAYAGCVWLADWTETEDWEAGALDAAAALILQRKEDAPDPVRDTARAILESHASQPGRWTVGDEDRAAMDALGFMDKNVSASCRVAHEGRCSWLSIFSRSVADLAAASTQRLARTTFTRAVHAPVGGHLTRKSRPVTGGTQARVLTVCLDALEILADFPDESEPAHTTTTNSRPRLSGRGAGTDRTKGRPSKGRARGRKPERDWTSERTQRVVVDAVDPSDITASLNAAADAGATDVVGDHRQWIIQRAQGWTSTWTAQGMSGMATRDSDGRTIRVWNGGSGVDAAALAEFYPVAPFPLVTPGSLVQKMLTSDEQGRTARLQLPDEQADLWTPDAVLHPVAYGDRATAKDSGATQWDRNKSHLPALTQSHMAPLFYGEAFEHYGADAPVDKALGGMYRIEVPAWSSDMPAPHGTYEAGTEGWVSPEIMRLYRDLGMAQPRVIEAWLAPVHRVPAVEHLADQIKTWLTEFDGRPGRAFPKLMYQATAGTITSEHNRGKHGRVFRPDWGQAIRDNSWANVLRRAYKVHAADARYIPMHVNVDALYYPPELGEETPPELPMGTGHGMFKREDVA